MRKYLILSGLTLFAVWTVWSCGDDDDTPTSVDEVETFTATLSGANEVPPVTTTATGTATINAVGGTLVYRVDVVGLNNPTLSHIHAPALAGTNVGVKVNFCTQAAPYPICPTGAPFTGTLTAGVATGSHSTRYWCCCAMATPTSTSTQRRMAAVRSGGR
jgi:hypothetical protein